MVLNDRKIKILEAIINDYVATAEPIGSRTIVKKYDLGISSATVRNEMSDLEDLGLIIQPHASSGRIPSDKGYRLYVDSLMRYRELTDEEGSFLRDIISNNINQIDYLMKETAKAISVLTNYTAIISEPQVKTAKIRHIQLVPFDDKSIIAVIVTDTKTVKNIAVNLEEATDSKTLSDISLVLNSQITGVSGLDLKITENLLNKFPGSERIVTKVLNALIMEFQEDEDVQIYTSGTKNILAFPEFSNIERAKEIFQALEEKRLLVTLLGQTATEDIEIVIGDENNIEQMKNCSIIKANFHIGGKKAGGIGIIGPTRMDYSQVASILNGIVKRINGALKALSGGG
ncbi:MAG: heat-inducible transcriptional repressor HrcA [Clostridiales bacterium]|jgi:heat-inducible transcriptional repressor|nr:heat-inducible transcriptional repressor HrcA [Clostridiales bacterium]